jgi:hypothetical protein
VGLEVVGGHKGGAAAKAGMGQCRLLRRHAANEKGEVGGCQATLDGLLLPFLEGNVLTCFAVEKNFIFCGEFLFWRDNVEGVEIHLLRNCENRGEHSAN